MLVSVLAVLFLDLGVLSHFSFKIVRISRLEHTIATDEAQDMYKDYKLQSNAIRTIHCENNRLACIFSSHGSPITGSP